MASTYSKNYNIELIATGERSVTTPSEDRTLDVGSPTISNTTDVLGTLIEDLQKSGVIS